MGRKSPRVEASPTNLDSKVAWGTDSSWPGGGPDWGMAFTALLQCALVPALLLWGIMAMLAAENGSTNRVSCTNPNFWYWGTLAGATCLSCFSCCLSGASFIIESEEQALSRTEGSSPRSHGSPPRSPVHAVKPAKPVKAKRQRSEAVQKPQPPRTVKRFPTPPLVTPPVLPGQLEDSRDLEADDWLARHPIVMLPLEGGRPRTNSLSTIEEL